MKRRLAAAADGRILSAPWALVPWFGALALGAASVPALAQPDAGTLLNQEQRSRERLPDRLPEAETEAVRPALKAIPRAAIVLESVRFSGATGLVSEAELQAVVADAIGTELDFAGLERLARRVTEFLRSRGLFLAEAYLPRQDVTDGKLEIAIRAGYLDGKTGEGVPYAIVPPGPMPLRLDVARLDAIASRLLPGGAPATERDLERAILLMNDLPGISARARLEPGAEEGSTRVIVDVEEGPLLTGSASVDNYGNRDSGVNQINVAAQLNDPLTVGDQVGLIAAHADGLDLARLSYVVPVGSRGAKFGAAWTVMEYEVLRGVGADAGLEGSAQTAAVTLTYPFLRSRALNLYGIGGYDHKLLQDDSAAGRMRDKRVDVWNLRISGDLLDVVGGGGLTSWRAGLVAGELDLGRVPSDEASDAATYDTQGRFGKLVYGLARLQKLPGAFTAFANVQGQRAGQNLDSSEKFILGGPNGVRAYPGSEASGDSGWLANLELRYELPGGTPLGRLQLTGFYDTGRITLHDDDKGLPIATVSGRNSYGLAGWGVGVNLGKTGSHSVRLSWAHKIGQNPGRTSQGLDADSRTDQSRIWLQAAIWL